MQICHHAVKRPSVRLLDVFERVHVAIIHVYIGISREFCRLVYTTTPLVDGCIELIEHISTDTMK
jgi:hypothetical protein